jgi:hypothetical protein|tara:strand:- start:12 stop:248 length:237 start_codon:yes stop_codon:yes gene_type:complete
MIRVCKPDETEHIRQAFVDNKNDNWATARYISPMDRRGETVFECFTCHSVEGTRRRFMEDGPTRAKVVRDWKRVHRHN